jgi:hypothetical protein
VQVGVVIVVLDALGILRLEIIQAGGLNIDQALLRWLGLRGLAVAFIVDRHCVIITIIFDLEVVEVKDSKGDVGGL